MLLKKIILAACIAAGAVCVIPAAEAQAAQAQVLPNQGRRLPPLIHKGTAPGPPGEGLNAQLAGAAEQVQRPPALNVKLDNIEQGLLHLVGGGTGLHPLKLL